MKFKEQRGFTLVEMLVALLIAGIFFSVFVGVVLATFETLRSGDERTVAQQNARVGLNFIVDDIRHSTEITPLRLRAYRDWADGGFPIADDTLDPHYLTDVDAWPIYRRSVDSDTKGYIDLDIDGGDGDGDEYEDFRDDGFPYDVRAIAPNRLELLTYGSTYYPNTEYWAGFASPYDIDNNLIPNATASETRVTYEHQLVAPHQEIYEGSFSGLEKEFNLVINRSDPAAGAIQQFSDFVIVRSFEALNPTIERPDVGGTEEAGQGDLGPVSDQLYIDQPYFRQQVADHVINLRFRYWHISGSTMLEIRYDPEEANIGGSGINTDDGYYRYYDIYGNEIYVWYNHRSSEMVPLIPTDPDDNDWDNVPANSFYIYGGDDGDDEYQRGLLLFEGWRYVNAVSVTVKTANNQTLNIYKSSINYAITDPDHPDYGMGFIDFGLGQAQEDMLGTLNEYDPFFQAADNVRAGTVPGFGFDFVEPNMNPNYNANAFTTLQTLVVSPALEESSDLAINGLRYGLGYKGNIY